MESAWWPKPSDFTWLVSVSHPVVIQLPAPEIQGLDGWDDLVETSLSFFFFLRGRVCLWMMGHIEIGRYGGHCVSLRVAIGVFLFWAPFPFLLFHCVTKSPPGIYYWFSFFFPIRLNIYSALHLIIYGVHHLLEDSHGLYIVDELISSLYEIFTIFL